MRAGPLRHKVVIQMPVKTQDPLTGEVTISWSDISESPIWARYEPLSAREFVASQSIQSRVTARFTIRYRPGILATMRILFDSMVFNIEGVLPDNKSGREYITLPVSEGVNDG